MSLRDLGLWTIVALVACGQAAAAPQDAAPTVVLEEVATGFKRPLGYVSAPDGTGRMFVVEQTGRITIIRADGTRGVRPFLDIGGLLHRDVGEMGLLGLAFHPKFKDNGRLFVGYTAKGLRDTVAEYRVAKDNVDQADPTSARVLLSLDSRAGNHNGGHVLFGPDGALYVGTGDGGAANDRFRTGRDTHALLAKMLRIDVDSPPAKGKAYAIPDDNPFADGKLGAPEALHVGLRNPWRYSFDRETGDLFIGDVGQNRFEMVHRAKAGSRGLDFGWSTVEASHCFRPKVRCGKAGVTLPVHEYPHEEGCSVTGGFVYRGTAIPALSGHYVFGDYCNGRIWSFPVDGAEPGALVKSQLVLDTDFAISSFGEDAAGELYVLDHIGGRVLKLRPAPAAPPPAGRR